MNPQRINENTSSLTPMKNVSLASTARYSNNTTGSFSQTFTNMKFPTQTILADENHEMLPLDSLQHSDYQDEDHQLYQYEKDSKQFRLLQTAICFMANEHIKNYRRIKKLEQVNKKLQKSNQVKERGLLNHKKMVEQKIKRKDKLKKTIETKKKQQEIAIRDQIKQLRQYSEQLNNQIQEMLHEKMFQPVYQNNQHPQRQQQPSVIIIPPSYPQQYPGQHQLPQQYQPQQQQLLKPQAYFQQRPNEVQKSVTNPFQIMKKDHQNQQQPVFFGQNMGDLINQGIMLNQKTQLNHKPSLKSLKEESIRSSMKKTAKQIQLFGRSSKNKMSASGKWQVDDQDNDLNVALSESLEKSNKKRKSTPIKPTDSLHNPFNKMQMEQSEVVINVEESITKQSKIHLSPEKIKRPDSNNRSMRQSKVHLDLPEEEKSGSRIFQSSQDEKVKKNLGLSKIMASPPVIKQILSPPEKSTSKNNISAERKAKKTQSQIQSELDIQDGDYLLDSNIKKPGKHSKKASILSEQKSKSKVISKKSQSYEEKKEINEVKEQSQVKKSPEDRKSPIRQSQFILNEDQIGKSEFPDIPKPKSKIKKSSVQVPDGHKSQQVQSPLNLNSPTTTPISSVVLEHKRSSEMRKSTSKPSSQIGQISDDSLSDINLLAISKISKQNGYFVESALSLQRKSKLHGSSILDEESEVKFKKQKQSDLNRFSCPTSTIQN